ncbi:hypothetical protein PC111_g1602 [Phytophthora cactorum]|nr:hypothetical protein PC111_g1602 [Phytophthora cactorum]
MSETTAKIVHSSALKKRIVKICDGEKLSAAESAALKRFETPRSDEQPGRVQEVPGGASRVQPVGGTRTTHVERL